MDQLVKATAGDVRIYVAVTTDLVSEGARRHQCSALAAAALGRTMTGALLMAANLKNQEAITLSFNGNGPLGRVVADANNNGFVRGYVQHPEVELPLTNGKLSVGQGIGHGLLNVTRLPESAILSPAALRFSAVRLQRTLPVTFSIQSRRLRPFPLVCWWGLICPFLRLAVL